MYLHYELKEDDALAYSVAGFERIISRAHFEAGIEHHRKQARSLEKFLERQQNGPADIRFYRRPSAKDSA